MQIVPQQFTNYAKGDVRPHSWGLRISFDKAYDDDVTFFTLDQSLLDSMDVLAPSEDNPIQAWDFYEYLDYSDRVTYMSWNRELEFPYSVVSARADFELANTDNYFTPNSASPIADYVLPKRPIRLLSGFADTVIPQFVGLTQGMPEVASPAKTAIFTALDFLTQIYDLPIRNTIAMRDARTDEVLSNIFMQFGLSPSQYDLAQGRNIIPFLFFERNQLTAGSVIRRLMQAEGGMLWLGEDGIIRFRPRLEPVDDPVYSFDSSEIISVGISNDDQIINTINFTGDIRVVQEYQTIYIKSEYGQRNIIPANSSGVFSAELTDPALSVDLPTYGVLVGESWFTAVDMTGAAVTSNVSITGSSLKTNSFDMFIQNNNSFDIDISQMELWGEPAKIVDTINKTLKYQPSIDKYDVKSIDIDNNFIQTEDQMESLGLVILDEYSEYASILDLEVKGNPALQLGDIVDLDYEQFSSNYRIIGISNELRDSKYTQILRLRLYTPRSWFVLDQSQLNGTDVLAP